jgi:hypothetical protein
MHVFVEFFLHFLTEILHFRLQVLEARDKLYRLINAKTTDISKVTSLKGTCRDMCPEKERLMREARLQVASFEVSEHDGIREVQRTLRLLFRMT